MGSRWERREGLRACWAHEGACGAGQGLGQLSSCSPRLGGMACPFPVSSMADGEARGPLSSSLPRLALWHQARSSEVGCSPQRVPARAPAPVSASAGELCIRTGGAQGGLWGLQALGHCPKLENVEIDRSDLGRCGRSLEASLASRGHSTVLWSQGHSTACPVLWGGRRQQDPDVGSTCWGSGLGWGAPHNATAVPTPRHCFLPPPLPSRSWWELQVFTCRQAAHWFAPAQAARTAQQSWPCPEGWCPQPGSLTGC